MLETYDASKIVKKLSCILLSFSLSLSLSLSFMTLAEVNYVSSLKTVMELYISPACDIYFNVKQCEAYISSLNNIHIYAHHSNAVHYPPRC